MRRTILIFIVAALLGVPFLWGGDYLASHFQLTHLFSNKHEAEKPKTVKVDRDNAPILVAMNKKFHSGDAPAAVRVADAYLAEFPNDVKVLSMRGWALSKMGRGDDADKSFDSAIVLDANYANAYVGKASLARQRGDFSAAEELYSKALKIEPNDGFTLASLCALEISREKFERAVSLCEAAYKSDDRVPFIAANLAVAYHKAGQVAQRDEMFQKARALKYGQMAAMKEMFYGKS